MFFMSVQAVSDLGVDLSFVSLGPAPLLPRCCCSAPCSSKHPRPTYSTFFFVLLVVGALGGYIFFGSFHRGRFGKTGMGSEPGGL